MVRLLFLGLDGATWDVLDPLIDDGELPNLARVVGEGSRAPLTSTQPPVTYPAWRVMSSGKHPGKLGVYGWNHPDFEKRRFVFPSAADHRTADVWDYVNDAGLSAAVINQPGTAPPRDIDGVMIAGPEAHGELVRPRERTDIAERYRAHEHGIATFLRRGDLPRALELIENGFDVAASLAAEVDVLHHVVFLTDTVQHHLWDDADALSRTWRTVDEGFGRLLDAAEPETVFIASDHGFQRLDHLLSINGALAEAGLATLSPPRASGALGRLGVDRARVLSWARRLGLSEARLAQAPQWLKELVPEATGGLGTRRERAVDWDATVALSGDGHGIHVSDPSRCDDVIEALEGLESPDGDALVSAVRRREDVWSGPFVELAPHLLVEAVDGVEPGGSIGVDVLRAPVPGRTWIAHHHPSGIFAAWGQSVRTQRLDAASIVDVAPTYLAALGLAIPNDLDGEVLGVFDRAPSTGTREPLAPPGEAAAYSAEEEALVQQRLEDLGYL